MAAWTTAANPTRSRSDRLTVSPSLISATRQSSRLWSTPLPPSGWLPRRQKVSLPGQTHPRTPRTAHCTLPRPPSTSYPQRLSAISNFSARQTSFSSCVRHDGQLRRHADWSGVLNPVAVDGPSGWKLPQVTGQHFANQASKVARRSTLHGFVTGDSETGTEAAATSLSRVVRLKSRVPAWILVGLFSRQLRISDRNKLRAPAAPPRPLASTALYRCCPAPFLRGSLACIMSWHYRIQPHSCTTRQTSR